MLQKKAVGSDLYEQVFYSLDLIEKDYFGLQYTDANNVQVSSPQYKFYPLIHVMSQLFAFCYVTWPVLHIYACHPGKKMITRLVTLTDPL